MGPCLCGDPYCGSCGPAMGVPYHDDGREDYQIETVGELADHLGAFNAKDIPRRLYKDTACGAWIEFKVEWEVPDANNVDSIYGVDWVPNLDNHEYEDHPIVAIRVGSIVEGSDVEPCVEPFELSFPFTALEFERAIADLERNVDAKWREINNTFFQIKYAGEIDDRGWIEVNSDGEIEECTYSPGYSRELMDAVQEQCWEATDYGTREGSIRVEYGDVATEYYSLVPYYPNGEVIGVADDEW